MEYYVVILFVDCGGLSGRCVCVVCVVCCLSACVRGRAYVCRRAHCSAGPVCGVCVRRVRRLLPVDMRAWAGVCVPSCSLLSCWRLDRRRGWSLCRRGAFGVVLNCIMKGNEIYNHILSTIISIIIVIDICSLLAQFTIYKNIA